MGFFSKREFEAIRNLFKEELAVVREEFSNLVNLVRSDLAEVKSDVANLFTANKATNSLIATALCELSEVRSELSEVHNKVDKLSDQVSILIGEVGRLSSRGELMLSVFGFCALYELSYTRGELALMGKAATRYSKKNGFKVETVADNTFGYVNVYERTALEDLFLGDETDDN